VDTSLKLKHATVVQTQRNTSVSIQEHVFYTQLERFALTTRKVEEKVKIVLQKARKGSNVYKKGKEVKKGVKPGQGERVNKNKVKTGQVVCFLHARRRILVFFARLFPLKRRIFIFHLNTHFWH
jgi:hypothetical protein